MTLRVGASASVGRFPNFLVIGAMKAGSTSLYMYLRAHPRIFMPQSNELSFFALEPDRERNLDWYRKQFAQAGPETLALGEASMMYTKYPKYSGVPARIAACIPDVRLIYLIRDPIERIRSHYEHEVLIGAELLPFEQAVREHPIYVDTSRYAMQIERYLACFRREQLLVITSEDLRNDRRATIRSVYEFLGVDSDFVPENLDREYFKTEERVPYPPLARRIRRALKLRFPATRRIRFSSPRLVRSLGRAYHLAASAQPKSSLVVGEEVRTALVETLREDVRQLRDHMPPGFHGWGIA